MMGQTKQRCTHSKTKRHQGTASHQVYWLIRHTSGTPHMFLPKTASLTQMTALLHKQQDPGKSALSFPSKVHTHIQPYPVQAVASAQSTFSAATTSSARPAREMLHRNRTSHHPHHNLFYMFIKFISHFRCGGCQLLLFF